ncbi:MAG TPA: YebC/PmpR family DNA-binding transcriptional regulator [Candidatus Saccharimonadales bacterium]|nr:YebC/PmpR family DNA-binding transcriptional regulator [Candidatus Saccharimonadales bacterium]
MSGHSKWSTIKRQKEATDSKRGALFTKLGHAIAIAARSGTDPATNFSLRLAIDKAKTANMPTVNIQRSIDRGSGKLGGEQIQEVLYEGYGPGGVAIMAEAATDNINRTYPNIRLVFSKHGGKIAEKGSVAFLFDRKGVLRINGQGDEILLAALDAGADDVDEEAGESIVYTNQKKLSEVESALRSAGLKITESGLSYVAKQMVKVEDKAAAGKIMRLLDALDDIDEVTNTYTNFDIPEELLES